MANITRGRDAPAGVATRELDPYRLMRQLMRWDPFRDIAQQGALERAGQYVPQFDVVETKDAYLFKADLPGVKEEDLDISVTGNRLTISGKRESEEREERENYFAYERSFGTFSRSFTLPEGTSTDDVHAELKDGVLTLSIPKKPEVQPRRIELRKESKTQKVQ